MVNGAGPITLQGARATFFRLVANFHFSKGERSYSSQPTAKLKPEKRRDRAQGDQQQTVRIAPCPIQFGHVLEVHSVHAGDERWRNADHRHDGQYLDDVVLLDVDHPQRGVEQQLNVVRQMRIVVIKRRDVRAQRLETWLNISRKPVGSKGRDVR